MTDVPHQSDSKVQRELETLLVQAAGKHTSTTLEPKVLELDGATVNLDGYAVDESNERIVLAEAYARTEKLKPGNKRKVLTDVLKLLYVRDALAEMHPGWRVRLYLVLSSELVAAEFRGKSWAAKALQRFGVVVLVHEFSEEELKRLATAVAAQREGMRG